MKTRKRYWKASKGCYTLLAALLALTLLTISLISPPPAHAATFTVNSTADTSDAAPGDGTCDDGTGVCTLRAAIEEANALDGADTINFDPTVFPPGAPATILLTSDSLILADSSAGTTIDGTGAGVIVDGNNNPALTEGFWLISDNNVLRRLQIQRFPGDGVLIDGSGNTVEYCYIGTDPAGNDLGNGENGVSIMSTLGTAGSNTVGPGNVIGFNDGDGVFIQGRNNVVRDNYIGTDAAGNDLGNGANGVDIQPIEGTGGSNTVGPGNVIGFNDFDGVIIWGSDNVVRGNYIGTDAAGKNLGNGVNGVSINSWAAPDGASNTVGPDNVIAFNGGHGVYVAGDKAEDNTITRNSIFRNRGLGIDLHDEDDVWPGVTSNDPDDTDTGPNELLNFPVISSVTAESVTGTACAGCTVEVFIADPDPSGHGEGKTFVGSGRADGTGNFNVAISGINAGDRITATATDGDGNTSEFSANVQWPQLGIYLPLLVRQTG